MLSTKKSISLTGTATVSYGGVTTAAVNMNAKIAESGTANIVTTIINAEAYENCKEECRADIDEFTAAVRLLEDAEYVEETDNTEEE